MLHSSWKTLRDAAPRLAEQRRLEARAAAAEQEAAEQEAEVAEQARAERRARAKAEAVAKRRAKAARAPKPAAHKRRVSALTRFLNRRYGRDVPSDAA